MMRASMNFPIQAAGASILKIAAVLLRRWIKHENLRDKVKILLPVHDEFLLQADENLATYVEQKLVYYMELAAKLALKSDLLKADSYIADHWVKD